MDDGLSFVVEMNEAVWARFVADLGDVTPEEADWRPLPQANSISAILRHLRIEAEWHPASLSHSGQTRALRNLYRKTRGEAARFHPENPTYPS